MSRFQTRDTAKDIILNQPPSGFNVVNGGGGGQRLPGIDNSQNNFAPRPNNNLPSIQQPTQQQQFFQPQPIVVQQSDPRLSEELSKLQSQMRQLQGQKDSELLNEKDARRRLEAQLRDANDAILKLSQRQANQPNDARTHSELESMKQARAAMEAQLLRMTQDIAHMKGMIDRHSADLMALNNELKSRPHVDPSKMSNTQQLESRVLEMNGQNMALRQALDAEINERRKNDHESALALARIQAMLKDEEARKGDMLKHLSSKENEGSLEAKRLNEKIQLITDEVTRNLVSKERSIRDETNAKYLALEKAIKAEVEARLQYENDIKRHLEKRWTTYNEEITALQESVEGDKGKTREKFMKINEALALLENQQEIGTKKIDKVMAAEIQSRKLHEKGLLSKLAEIEDRVTNHFTNVNRSIDDSRRTGKPANIPTLDTDGLRRDLDALSGERNKLSMEGLVKLEEKLARIEAQVDRENKGMKEKFEGPTRASQDLDPDTLNRIRHQMRKLDDLQDEIEKSHNHLRDKVERQLPQSIEDLSMKLENMRRQMLERLDATDREREQQLREMANQVNSRTLNNTNDSTVVHGSRLERDVEECQIGIKKLAESVTTVKNVLSRKIDEETRTRERDVAKLQEIIYNK